ncbi:PIG-L deacetylase family protein, partial [Nocardioides sp.]|uniref:PIG-L deacetylase family protein n=1 Tax=Nocardioides sp. TaxID=35761 RepID=UPI002734FC44
MTEQRQAPRLQVVVAHPDDETFGCGGLLLHARAVGFETYVTCATRGEAGEDRDGRSRSELGAVRADELRQAATRLGVTDVELFDYQDSGMGGPTPPRTLVGADMEHIVATVTASLRRVRPHVVLTLDASDGHRDHVRIKQATLRAAEELGVPTVYLSCLPQSLMRRWVAHVRADQPDKEHVRDGEMALGTPDEEISTLIDVREHREPLAQAAAAHRSQDSPYDRLPPDLRDAFLNTARARRVRPTWDGATLEDTLSDLVSTAVDRSAQS